MAGIEDIENYRNITYEQKIAELETRIKILELVLMPKYNLPMSIEDGKIVFTSPTTVPVIELPHI